MPLYKHLFALSTLMMGPAVHAASAGDALAQILWRQSQTGENALYQMNGATLQGVVSLPKVSADWQAWRADLNGDGVLDIVWRNRQTGQNWWHQITSGSVVKSVAINKIPTDWQLQGIGDFNGDGKDDLLWQQPGTGLVWQYSMQANQIVQQNKVAQVKDSQWRIAGIGDVNGDGHDDIIWRHGQSGVNYIYLMQNGQIASQYVLNTVPSVWQLAAIADVNGDGHSDMVWRNTQTGVNWLYQMHNGQVQSSQRLNTVSDQAWQIADVGDYNGDGTDDLFWFNRQSGQTAVYLLQNSQIQTSQVVNKIPVSDWAVVGQTQERIASTLAWLETGHGFAIRGTHPRVLLDSDHLKQVIERMTGPKAREPYSRWYSKIKANADTGNYVDLVSLALIYQATQDASYLNQLIERLPQTGVPSASELYAVDIVFDKLSDAVKYQIMQRANANPNGFYWNALHESIAGQAMWGYHSAAGVTNALAYSGVFALSDVEKRKDPKQYPFDTLNYLKAVHQELSPSGHFWQLERRIAGDMTHNDALAGSQGGMYDNLAYDQSEEAHSMDVLLQFQTLTGKNVSTGAWHDEYRATFYQNLQYPHLYKHYDSNVWCRKGGTESHVVARIWNTQTDYISQPQTEQALMAAFLYQDPRMQYYVDNGVQLELCGNDYAGLYLNLIFYDDKLSQTPPSSNPTAMYFSGPGLVSMRSDWSNEAAFAVFMAGEGISRRYEDANSFLLSRKVDIIPHAGARIRHDYDNDKHHWYAIRSIAKNTLKIFDPQESFDINPDGTTGPLHSGTALVASDNMGGQLFETAPSTQDRCYYAPDSNKNYGCASTLQRKGDAFPLGLYETANIIKFEHVDGDYTYTVGDGSAAYSKKIEYFEREFVFLRPDLFVIFDRVKSSDPSFKKVWTIHTVDKPHVDGPISESGMGLSRYDNASHTQILNGANHTYIDTLLPVQNQIEVRGGDTLLATGQSLTNTQVQDPDMPRWLELFAVGNDTEGTLTLHGDAQEGDNISEDVVFNGNSQSYHISAPTRAVSSSELQDTTQHWQTNQWAGYRVKISTSPSQQAIITGNNENTLFGQFTAGNAWQYEINRPVANTYLHWKHIDSLSSQDMDIENLTVSIPHYFDAEDASGRLHSFAPHTDSKHDSYRKRNDFGQWTLNITATQPQQLDNFLNVISLKDPDVAKPNAQLLQADGISGVWLDHYFVLFANTQTPLSDIQITLPSMETVQGLVFDLQPNTAYYAKRQDNNLSLSTTNNGGTLQTSSAMGSLKLGL